METHNKLLVAVGAVAIIAIGVIAFWHFEPVQAPSQEPTAQQQVQQGPQITDKTIKDTTKPFNIDVTYPQVAGLDGLNAEIESYVTADLAQFKKDSLDNDATIKQVDPQSYAKYPREYDYQVTYTRGEVDSNVISVLLAISDFTGGAHGAYYYKSFNYDVVNKKDVALADLFPNQPSYLQTISNFTKADLIKQLNTTNNQDNFNYYDASMVSDGTSAKLENFSTFLIQPDAITFYFPPYQVAAGVVGPLNVVMPRSAAK